MTFALAPELTGIVRPGLLWFSSVRVVEREPRMDAPIAATEAAMRSGDRSVRLSASAEASAGPRHSSKSDGGQPDLDSVRTMYKRVGIDPTKRRPSSEALLRRVLKGDGLPRINSCVDVCNWCSLEFQLPYGLYDAARIEGDVTLRIGRDGESYPGIRKDDVHVGGRITLADATGPFGNPTSDSARTMVTLDTSRVLLVVFAPVSTDGAHLGRVLDVTGDRMTTFTGARVDERVG